MGCAARALFFDLKEGPMTRNSACQRLFALGPILALAALLALIGGASGKAAPTGLVAAYSFDGGTGTRSLTSRATATEERSPVLPGQRDMRAVHSRSTA